MPTQLGTAARNRVPRHQRQSRKHASGALWLPEISIPTFVHSAQYWCRFLSRSKAGQSSYTKTSENSTAMSESQNEDPIDPLTRLAIKHGTDKWGPHFYTPLYHTLFHPLRNRLIRLLEIGVGGNDFRTIGGASLAMWAEYFPHGLLTGIDIAEKRLTLDPRIKLFRGSQDDPIFLKNVCAERGPFDIIIDDGSHTPKHVVASFNILFPSLADGGLYVIEDVQTAFWPLSGGSLMHGGETMKLARTIIECLNHAEIAVVDRSHSLPSFAHQIKSFRAFHNVLVVRRRQPRAIKSRLRPQQSLLTQCCSNH